MIALRSTCVFLLLSACGGTSAGPDGGLTCEASGRTCASIFGAYQVVATAPAGCATNLTMTLTFSAFDGGAGTVTWQPYVMQATRQECSTVLPMGLVGIGAGPVDFAYDPACDSIRATLNRCCSYPDGGRDACTLIGTR